MKRRKRLKRGGRLPRFSRTGALKHAIYLAQRADFLRARPRCEFKRWSDGSPAPRHVVVESTNLATGETRQLVLQCRRRSTQVHHMRGRGRWHLDKRYWFPTCAADHRWINDNGREAERLGYVERVREKHEIR